jgi:hypothetical protein
MMTLASVSAPVEATAMLGRGLIQAWHLVDTSLSPRIGLEWVWTESSLPSFETFSFLHPV